MVHLQGIKHAFPKERILALDRWFEDGYRSCYGHNSKQSLQKETHPTLKGSQNLNTCLEGRTHPSEQQIARHRNVDSCAKICRTLRMGHRSKNHARIVQNKHEWCTVAKSYFNLQPSHTTCEQPTWTRNDKKVAWSERRVILSFLRVLVGRWIARELSWTL